MMKLSWAIRSKNDWQHKMKQDNIMSKWKEEAISSQQDITRDIKLTTNMVAAFCITHTFRMLMFALILL